MSQERAARGGGSVGAAARRRRRTGQPGHRARPLDTRFSRPGNSPLRRSAGIRRAVVGPEAGRFAGVFGPAAIVASVSIGAGETIVVVRAGGVGALRAVVAVLLSCVVKGVFVTYLLGRYTAVSGEHIGHRLVRLPGLTEQRHVWSNIHGSLIRIYYIAIIAALWGTLQALPEVYARVMQEFGQAIRPHRNWSYDRIKRIVCGYLLVTTFIIVWLDVPFDILTQWRDSSWPPGDLADDGRGAVPQLQATRRLPHPAADAGRRGGVGASLFAFAGISGWGLAGKLFGSG